MGRAKDIVVKVIKSKDANRFVKEHHYSGKVVVGSSLHFGAFLDGKLHGVMSYGSPLSKKRVLPLVETKDGEPVKWNEMLELNRMAFDDYLPKNSESRCIAISIKLLKKNAPHIKWILSFSDATQCGDGAIYRASGFTLTDVKKNFHNYKLPNGKVLNILNFSGGYMSRYLKDLGLCMSNTPHANVKISGALKMVGYQLRYIYLIDKTCKITVPILPFSKIDEIGAGMYKGEKITLEERKRLSSIDS